MKFRDAHDVRWLNDGFGHVARVSRLNWRTGIGGSVTNYQFINRRCGYSNILKYI
jgi:hypothetical protein